MKIGIHDAEGDHMPHKTFPNYALMKIAAWHKQNKNEIEWWNPLKKYDMVYSSKIFDFTPENLYLPEQAVRGGTGYGDIGANLNEDIEKMFPDYSMYPNVDYAIGYITRGCPNHCPWCIVPEKEGELKPYRDWRELVRPDSNRLKLMDNNILASGYGITQLESLIGSKYKIDLNQGMDVRLVDNYIAEILAKLKWIKFIRFSCDQKSQIDHILKVAELLQKNGKKPYNLFIYLLVRKDIEDAAYRVEKLKHLKGMTIYAQPEINPTKGILPNAEQKEFAQRFVYGRCYLKESWPEYLKRHPEVERKKNEADTALLRR